MFPPSQPPSDSGNAARVLLLPSAGMGHLVPFVRLATALSARGAAVSLLAVRPTVSASESRLLSSLPPSLLLDFPVSPLDPSLFPPSSDPFFLRFKSLSRSAHLLLPLLSGDPPVSSLIVDITVAASFLPFAASANVPCFVLFTSSAAMLALLAAFPFLPLPTGEAIDVEIAGFKIPVTSLPPPLSDPNHLFTTQFLENGRALPFAAGIVINTFDALEPLTISALNSGEVVPCLPPIYVVGPLPLLETSPYSPAIQWLDEQPDRSVVYVSFGSRTAMSRDQIRELAKGLEMSGRRFLWALKTKKVDREDVAVEIEEFVGEGYLERVEGRGMVERGWVEQEVVLGHRAVAGFLSHCGWNSVVEAAAAGVRMVAWPRHGDQRVNAAVVAASGMGVWPEEWGWEVQERVVAAAEIGKKVREVMDDERIGEAAGRISAIASAGSSKKELDVLFHKLIFSR